MSYVSSFEELAREEGFEQGFEQGRIDGRHESILIGVEGRFDTPLTPEAAQQLKSIRDLTILDSILRSLFKIETLEGVLLRIEASRG